MPNPNFNVDVWEQEESARQNERISRLGHAFAEIMKTQRSLAPDQAPGLLSQSDVIDATLPVYGNTDGVAIHAFLEEAINAGIIDGTEVGGKNRAIYSQEHTSLYLLTAEGQGWLRCQDNQYFLPEETN